MFLGFGFIVRGFCLCECFVDGLLWLLLVVMLGFVV